MKQMLKISIVLLIVGVFGTVASFTSLIEHINNASTALMRPMLYTSAMAVITILSTCLVTANLIKKT